MLSSHFLSLAALLIEGSGARGGVLITASDYSHSLLLGLVIQATHPLLQELLPSNPCCSLHHHVSLFIHRTQVVLPLPSLSFLALPSLVLPSLLVAGTEPSVILSQALHLAGSLPW